MQIFAGVIATALMLVPVASEAEALRTIHTNGSGTVEARPDMAVVSVGVVQQARDASGALAAASLSVRAVLDVLEGAGIENRDIATGSVSVQPLWNNRNQSGNEAPRITGFRANNTLTVRVRDLDSLGSVLDAAVRDGANSFNGLQFGFQDPEPLEDRARAAAVRDAMRRAAQIADASGVTLGPVLKITEGGPANSPIMETAGFARMSDVPVAPGEKSVSVSVQIIFEIAD